ncbi:MAG: peptidylprolyl isomerase [Sphingobacteriales bacterium]|nr:MAG: peptidylprolyl isomerase [Sphingobacteriales bacterium]
MKKILGLSVLILALLSSCKKDDECKLSPPAIVAPANEIQAVKDYLTSKSITAIQDPSGVFYVNTQEGTGAASPTVCNTVVVKYKGTFTNGNVFDDSGSSSISFPLEQLIVGWQIIIPKMKKGGKATLYIPPTLGYGSRDIVQNGVVIIPANSILIFDIELLNF